jgi:cell migration-inducing and hyaluronan-binding protein
VYFPPLERKWANDLAGSAAWKIAAIHDRDGSVGGIPDAYILINDGAFDSIAADAQACTAKPDWNATVCKGDIGRLSFAAARSESGVGTARPAGASGPPPAVPVILSRNGKSFTIAQNSNVRAGTEISARIENPSVTLTLNELDSGSWVILELPGFHSASAGAEQASLDALRKASGTSYYKGKDALWLKVVSDGSGARVATPGSGTSLTVSR